MSRDTKVLCGPSIYERIEHVRMTASDRKLALNALRQADLIVDALMWVGKKIGQGGARIFLKPSLKH